MNQAARCGLYNFGYSISAEIGILFIPGTLAHPGVYECRVHSITRTCVSFVADVFTLSKAGRVLPVPNGPLEYKRYWMFPFPRCFLQLCPVMGSARTSSQACLSLYDCFERDRLELLQLSKTLCRRNHQHDINTHFAWLPIRRIVTSNHPLYINDIAEFRKLSATLVSDR